MTRREYQLRGIDRRSKKTYLWEDQWGDWNRRGFYTKAKEARSWIHWASRRWGTVPPTVHSLGAKGHMSFAHNNGAGKFGIYLTDRHNNIAIALHEAAHVIDDQLPSPVKEHHGKRWLAIYLDLLGSSGQYPKTAVEASAKAAGLKWDTTVRPPRKKKARKKRAS